MFLGTDLLACGTWRAFERALFRLLLHKGFEWARLTGGPGDRGSDIVGYYRGHYWTVQAKFSLNRTVPGPNVIREIAEAVAEYRTTQAILATNASLSDARGLVAAAEQYTALTGVPIHLMGRERLSVEMNNLAVAPAAQIRYPIRDYQADAVAAIAEAARTRAGNQAAAMVAMATGTGKSRVCYEFVSAYLQAHGEREVLVLVEAVELARQLERASWDVLPKTVTTHLWAGGDVPAYSGGPSVTFATTDSVIPNLGTLIRPGRFSLLVIDEAHHAAADSTRRLIRDLAPQFRLGMTATPWRGDDRTLEQIFGGYRPVYHLGVVEAIRRGYLAEVQYVVYDDHLDWDYVARQSRMGLTIADLNRTLWIPERENLVSRITREWIDDLSRDGVAPRTIMFCRSIDHTTAARVALNAAGVAAAELHSGLSKFDITRTLQQFRDGTIRVVVAVDMLNEGIDVPDVELIVFNRVTHSRRVFLQQLGRGLRKTPNKDRLVVLDFVADIRRLAELAQLDSDYASSGLRASEVVDVPQHLVSFQSREMEHFVDAYLRDVGNLNETADDTLLTFP